MSLWMESMNFGSCLVHVSSFKFSVLWQHGPSLLGGGPGNGTGARGGGSAYIASNRGPKTHSTIVAIAAALSAFIAQHEFNPGVERDLSEKKRSNALAHFEETNSWNAMQREQSQHRTEWHNQKHSMQSTSGRHKDASFVFGIDTGRWSIATCCLRCAISQGLPRSSPTSEKPPSAMPN